jgi:excisionase family DNA binding protein
MDDLNEIKLVLDKICNVLATKNYSGSPISRAMTVKEVQERFRIGSTTTVISLFKAKGSPAYKIGKSWRVDKDDFKKFLIKISHT